MRTISVIEFLSLDGVMQGLGSPDEDTRGGFSHGGWGAPYASAIHETVTQGGELEQTNAYLFGRLTFEKMAAFWPTQPDENPMAAHLNATAKYVASRSLSTAEAARLWRGSEVLPGDAVSAAQALKATGGGTMAILGSGDLVRQLLAVGEVDSLQLFVHPLLLGTGTRLFGDLDAPVGLRLEHVATTSLGTVVLTYLLSA